MDLVSRLEQPSLYERDFAAWADAQAALLRTRRWDQLDIEHLIEEVESLGRDQRSRIASRTLTIIVHLMKLAASASHDPERGWVETVQRSRGDLAQSLEDNPSLATAAAFDPVLDRAHERARREVADTLQRFGELTPDAARRLQAFRVDRRQLLATDWFPQRPGN